MTTIEINEAKLHQVVGRALDDVAALSSSALVLIGGQLGLYDALGRIGPATPQELAEDLMYSDINPAVDIAVSLQAHGTIQLRLLNASYDPEELILAAELLARIIHGIHTHHPGLKNYLTTTPVTEIRLIEVARALGVPSFCYLALTGS